MARDRKRGDDDFADEVQSHLDHEAEDLIRDGATAADAQAAAHRRFGNVTRVRERFHESRRVVTLDQIVQDVRAAWRGMARYPVACGVAVLSLAAGIGSTTATLTVRNAVFRNPPPLYDQPEHLSRVRIASPARQRGGVPAPLFERWIDDPALRPSLAAAAPATVRDVRAGDRLETLSVRPVTAELFSLLGVAPALGRTFDSQQADATPVVLSHHAWTRLFDAQSSALGTVIWLDRAPHIVVGVMPERFWFSSMNDGMWTPLPRVTPAADARDGTTVETFDVVLRDRTGARDALVSSMQRGLAQYVGGLPATQRELRLVLSSVRGTPIAEQVAPYVVWLLAASVFLTLAIACTNVAILVMAQWTAREQEIAIRTALGASRARVVRALLVESTLIAVFGGVLGIGATYALLGILVRGGGVSAFALSIDPAVLIQSIAITVLAGVLTGVAPALYETRRAHRNPLRATATSDRVRQLWRHGLVVFEIAVTVALLVVTAAIVSAYRRMLSTDVGFDTHALITARVERSGGVSIAPTLELLRAMPGVTHAAAASAVPMVAAAPTRSVGAEAAAAGRIAAGHSLVGIGFFEALGVSVVKGRSFAAPDVASAARVAIVNENLAARLWPREEPRADPLGASIWLDDERYQVIGVVESHRTAPLGPPQPAIYVPLRQNTTLERVHFVLRASGDGNALVSPVRTAIRDLDPGHRGVFVIPIEAIMATGAQELLTSAFPMVPLIATGLLLVAAGIYGVLTFAITRRSRELAIRLALGASHADLLRLVMRQSARLVAAGAVIGIALTFVLTRLAQGRGGIFDSPGASAFLVPLLVIVVVGAAATLGPFRRALRVSPVSLLRAP
jgi:putative ABC transport system permease protein